MNCNDSVIQTQQVQLLTTKLTLIRAAGNLIMVVCKNRSLQLEICQLEWIHLILLKCIYMNKVFWAETNNKPSEKKKVIFTFTTSSTFTFTRLFTSFCFIKTTAIFILTLPWGNYEQISFIKYHRNNSCTYALELYGIFLHSLIFCKLLIFITVGILKLHNYVLSRNMISYKSVL